MKKFMFASCLFAALAFTACSDDDNDNNDGGVVTPPTANEAIDAFNLKYDLEASLDVDTAIFNYPALDGYMFSIRDRINEQGDTVPDFQGQYYEPADNEYVYKVLKFIEDEVFPVFGTEFISRYMPRTIYFCSKAINHIYYTDKDVRPGVIAQDISYPFDGGFAVPNYIMFSHCCADFDAMDKNYLKRLYVSLVTEYIFAQHDSQLEVPTEFNEYSVKYTTGFSFMGISFSLNENCSGSYESNSDEFATGYLDYAPDVYTRDEVQNGENLWHWPHAWYGCELRPARVGANELHKAKEVDIAAGGIPYSTIYLRPCLAQVMGDYVAFIVTTTAAEKEEYFAEVQASLDDPETEFQGADSYMGDIKPEASDVVPDMKARMQLCKDYFASYGVTLTDKE